jgi:4-hydroxybenzoate decarboxylase subunit C
LKKNFDPREDLTVLPGTAQDTLDFTSFTMNLGSKMVLDATSLGKDRSRLPKPKTLPPHPGLNWLSWKDALLVFQAKEQEDAKEALARLVRDPSVAGYRLVVAVSPDVPLDDPELLLWGIFTRFDCARDLVPAKASFAAGGAWPVFEGPIGIDATWKPGYPKPLVMDPDVVKKVDRLWDGLKI